MTQKKITARRFRETQGDILDNVCFKGAHYIITRHGKKTAVLISPKDFELFQKAIELIEDESDIRDAESAFADYHKTGKAKSLEDLSKELGIDI